MSLRYSALSTSYLAKLTADFRATALLKYPNCSRQLALKSAPQLIGTKTSFKSSSRVFCRDGSPSRARPTAVSTTGNPANCSPPTRVVHERPDSPEDNHG